jgi:hypothetical protein
VINSFCTFTGPRCSVPPNNITRTPRTNIAARNGFFRSLSYMSAIQFYLKTYYEKLSTFLSESQEFVNFLAESEEGEEFWLWLPDMRHPEKIVKFKKTATKILRQD